jgi:hypothetical protein
VFVLTRMLQISHERDERELTCDIDFGKALEATEQIYPSQPKPR